MLLFKGRPDFVINRNGLVYKSGDKGVLTANTEEEESLFKAYGFKAVVAVVEQEAVKEVKSKFPISNNV